MHLWLSVLVQIVHKFMQGLQILRNRITYSKTKGIYSKRLSTWCRRINTCHEEYSWSQGQMHLSLLSTVHLARQRHAHIWWTDVRCPSIPRVCVCVFGDVSPKRFLHKKPSAKKYLYTKWVFQNQPCRNYYNLRQVKSMDEQFPVLCNENRHAWDS